MNGKALPPRPGTRDGPGSQENAYRLGAREPASPSGKVVLEGYQGEVLNGFAGEKARYNPVSFSVSTENVRVKGMLICWVADEYESYAELNAA